MILLSAHPTYFETICVHMDVAQISIVSTDLAAVWPASSGGLHQPPGPADLLGVPGHSLHLLDKGAGGQAQPQQPPGEKLGYPAITALKHT